MSDVASAIRESARIARARMDTLTGQAAEQLRALYDDLIQQLQRDLQAYSDEQGRFRAESLAHYLAQARQRLRALGVVQEQLLNRAMHHAADLGVRVWAVKEGGLPVALLPLLADAAVRFVTHFIAADGLRLSNRLWRIESGALQVLADALRRAIVQGRDAYHAIQDMENQPIPPDLKKRLGMDRVESLGKTVAEVLSKDPNNAYSRALRVFRTELNRSHGEAYRQGASRHPDVIGERFMLSPNHPKTDACDGHAKADLYGLGPGVYPVGKAPWPAHPNTMSYVVAVFRPGIR